MSIFQTILMDILTMNNNPHTLDVLEKLRKNSHIAKHSHFTASKRSKKGHAIVGLSIILINLTLGSVFTYQLFDNSSLSDNYDKLFVALVALISACLGAVQTFFNFQKKSETHRALANRYLTVARECERIIASYRDGNTNLKEVDNHTKMLNKEYDKINIDAEAFPTSDRDFQRSMEIHHEKIRGNPPQLETN